MKPAELAALDQAKAGLDNELDVLISMSRLGRAETSDIQVAANITAWLPTRYDEVAVRALLATAVGRLAEEVTEP